ncbi:hypothetical protein QF045_002554 [Pseudomonas sp. W4I3]|nr:hypothetical protein [Pseudomonas sp. W4I3]
MDTLQQAHTVYIQKGYDSKVYEMYSFKALSTASTLKDCASRFGLAAFIITVEGGQPLTHYVQRCGCCESVF